MSHPSSITARVLTSLAMALAVVFAMAGGVSAQDNYPNRAVKMIVAQPPGNSADLVGRMISERLSRALGQAVVVDNRPGASGSIGMAALASSAADGYTIGIGGIGQLALNPTLYSKLPYDAQNGFTTLAIVYRGPMLFMVDPASPITSLKDLVQQSQAQATGLDFASAGTGSIMHLVGEQCPTVVPVLQPLWSWVNMRLCWSRMSLRAWLLCAQANCDHWRLPVPNATLHCPMCPAS